MTSVRIPEFAYQWRPFASRNMIFKKVSDKHGVECNFAIDPETQRWAVIDALTTELLKNANGRLRFSELIRSAPKDGDWDPAATAEALVHAGLLYDSKAKHDALSMPVYNSCEPIGLHLEITNACNMTCTHCYVASGIKLPNELTQAEIFKAIDFLPSFSGKRVAISGGEPIVRRGCMEIVEYCAISCGHDVDLYTNGRKFPERFASQIVEINSKGLGQVRLQLSLEGAKADSHDKVRGKGAFADAIESLAMFRRIGLGNSTVLFVCLTKANIGEVDELIALAENSEVGMLVFSQWQRQGNASNTPWATIAPSTSEWVEAGDKLMRYRHPVLRVFGNFYGDLTNGGPLNLDQPLFPKHVYYYNAFPRITPQGDILADQLWVDPAWVLGNVRDLSSLESCFRSSKFHEQLEQMRARSDSIDECKACEWKNLCQSGSAGHTYAEYGHMNAKDLFCESRKYWFERYVDHQMREI